jgi:PAS domain S-box-containing protein
LNESPPRTEVSLDEQLRTLVDVVPDLLALAGTDGYFRWLSPQWETVLGWSREELASRPFLEFVHPADRATTLREIARLGKGGSTIQFENRYACPDGSYRWLEWSATPTDDGTLYSSARDITDRKAAEQALLQRTNLLEMSENVGGVGHWRVDLRSGEDPFWSPQVYAMHGRDPAVWSPTLAEAIEAYHPDDRAMVSRVVQRCADEQVPFNFEARIRRPDGSVRYIASQGVPELDSDGEAVAIFGVIRDLTEERELRQALLHSERMVALGTLAAGIAHEINNPLGYLLGNVELAAEMIGEARSAFPADEHAELQDILDNALSGALRIRKIVEGMGSFSRVGEGSRDPTDLRRVVRSALEITGSEIRSRAQLVTDLPPVPPVEADENQLVQVLINLILNACQALPPGSPLTQRVEVALRHDASGVTVRVSDTGPGVPEEIRGRIFDPFFTTKEVGSGTGLGLSIAQSILLAHGGALEVADRPGGGATFLATLPAVRGAEVAEPPEDETDARPRILAVDDEPQIVSFLKRALGRDYHVIEACSGREALDAVTRNPDFAVILCDLMMADVTGMDVYRRLQDEYPDLVERFVVITGGAFTPEAETFVEEEPVLVLRKPIDLALLRDTVREHAARSAE